MGTDRRQRILLICAVAVVGLLLADKVVIGPLMGVWKSWSDTIRLDTENLAKFSPKRAADLQTRWADMKRHSLPRELPEAESQVFSAVGKWAGSSHLALNSVQPKWLADDKDAKSKKVEFTIKATGSLSSIAGFLYALETDPMPLRVEDFEMTTKDPKGAQLTFSLRFTGLVLLEEKS